MNGQLGRQQLVRALLKAADVTAVVETGTHRGTTTEFLWHLTGVPVWTVESSRRFVEYARRRFAGIEDVHVVHSDSRAFLRQLADDQAVPKERVFFYLDAHWGGSSGGLGISRTSAEVPLREELLLIREAWTDPIILIDDFQVPDDPGYGFDDYGPGRRLSVDYLPLDELGDVVVLFPTLPSHQETGHRKGCVVLADAVRAMTLQSAAPLRAHDRTARDSP